MPAPFVRPGNRVYFSATTPDEGLELWRVDDSGNASLTADIVPGKGSSNAAPVISLNGVLIVGAQDATHGVEWWVTDGTAGGTRMLKDLNPGSANGSPGAFLPFKDALYFIAAGGLWKTDGTEAGTVKVASLQSMRNSGRVPASAVPIAPSATPGVAQADVTIAGLTGGVHTIRVVYSGDARYKKTQQDVRVGNARGRAVRH